MPQLIDRPTRRQFTRMDVLARMGETICIDIPVPINQRPFKPVLVVVKEIAPVVPVIEARIVEDEDPERWDGMA